MSKNVTLNGHTYSGVSAIQIGTAKFIEESEAGISKQTFTIDQEYSENNVHGVKWLLETYFGSITDGVYIAKTLNNTGFSSSGKEPYGLEYMVIAKHNGLTCGTVWKTGGTQTDVNSFSNQSVTYLAQGATLKTAKISEESI